MYVSIYIYIYKNIYIYIYVCVWCRAMETIISLCHDRPMT